MKKASSEAKRAKLLHNARHKVIKLELGQKRRRTNTQQVPEKKEEETMTIPIAVFVKRDAAK